MGEIKLRQSKAFPCNGPIYVQGVEENYCFCPIHIGEQLSSSQEILYCHSHYSYWLAIFCRPVIPRERWQTFNRFLEKGANFPGHPVSYIADTIWWDSSQQMVDYKLMAIRECPCRWGGHRYSLHLPSIRPSLGPSLLDQPVCCRHCCSIILSVVFFVGLFPSYSKL